MDALEAHHLEYGLALPLRQWVDDLSGLQCGTWATDLGGTPPAVASLRTRLEAKGFSFADKSAQLATHPRLLAAIVAELERLGCPLEAAQVSPDLGLDQTCRRRTARPKARGRRRLAVSRKERVRRMWPTARARGTLFKTGALQAANVWPRAKAAER